MSLRTPKLLINQKVGTLRKPPYLLCFQHIRASGSGVISTPKTLKNLPWNPYCHFGAPNHENVTKMTPKWTPRGFQNPPKIDKNLGLDPPVSSGVSPGSPRPPKWSPRVLKWSIQASEITGLGTKSDPIHHTASPASPINLLYCITTDSIVSDHRICFSFQFPIYCWMQSSTGQLVTRSAFLLVLHVFQMTSYLSTKGPAAVGVALK